MWALRKHSASLIRIGYNLHVPSKGFSVIHLSYRQGRSPFVRAFSLLRNERSIHAIGWWFGKYSKKRIACLTLPLTVAGLSTLLTRSNINPFETLNKPPLSPSGWLFTVVWTILFVLMEIASYLEVSRNPSQTALTIYVAQLLFHFVWSLFFQHGTIPVCLYLARDFVAALDYNRTILSDIQAGWTSHAAISRMGDLCEISEFCHLSVKSAAGSLREHNRQITGMKLARFCDCGVNPSMIKWVCWKLYRGAGKGREIPFSEWCFYCLFWFLDRQAACFPDGPYSF